MQNAAQACDAASKTGARSTGGRYASYQRCRDMQKGRNLPRMTPAFHGIGAAISGGGAGREGLQRLLYDVCARRKGDATGSLPPRRGRRWREGGDILRRLTLLCSRH